MFDVSVVVVYQVAVMDPEGHVVEAGVEVGLHIISLIVITVIFLFVRTSSIHLPLVSFSTNFSSTLFLTIQRLYQYGYSTPQAGVTYQYFVCRVSL